MSQYTLLPEPKIQFFGNNGLPLNGGYLYTYVTGTPGVQKATYSDYSGTTANTNPIILDAYGRASVWLSTGAYLMQLWTGDKTSGTSTMVWSIDGVSAGMVNPMTNSGDMIYGGASGLATRLAKGTDGQILTMSGELPTWGEHSADNVSLTTDQTITGAKTFDGGIIITSEVREVPTVANTTTAYTIDIAEGTIFDLTLTGNCTFTFPADQAGRQFKLLLTQDGTGSRTVSWPSDVRWPGGTVPTLTTTASRTDIFSFVNDGTYWLGCTSGQNYTRA